MGKKTTEEYAKEFENVGILEQMGIVFDASWGGMNKLFGGWNSWGGKSTEKKIDEKKKEL